MMAYSEEVLKIICPICHGVGKCLEKTKDGSKYMESPHPERVTFAGKTVA